MYAEKLTPNEAKNIVEASGLYTYVSSRPELNGNHDFREHETIVNVINNKTNKPAVIILTDFEVSNISDKRIDNYESRFAILDRSHNARKINKALVETYVSKFGEAYVTKAQEHRNHTKKLNEYNINTAKLVLENLNYSEKSAKEIELITTHQRKIIERYTKYLALEKTLLAELNEAAGQSCR